MTSEPVRDPLADHLLTPQNCALIIIDYQPTQIRSIKSMDQDVLAGIGQGGGKPTSLVRVACELSGDGARQDAADGSAQILFRGDRPLAGASTEPSGNEARAGR